MSDDDEDFDSIFASKGNHASIYINAISQAASVKFIFLLSTHLTFLCVFLIVA
jgi:hypothetical protein